MKFTCLQENLNDCLGVVAAALPNKPVLPALNCVVLKTEADGRISLSATDLTVSLNSGFSAKAQQPGTVLVRGAQFRDVISTMPNSILTLSTAGTQLKIEGKGTTAKLSTLLLDEYPVASDFQVAQSIEVEGAAFRDSLRSVLFSIAQNHANVALSGVEMSAAGGYLILVTCDGSRMTIVECGDKVSTGLNFLLPKSAAEQLVRLEAETVQLETDKLNHRLRATVGSTVLVSLGLSGVFVDWRTFLKSTEEYKFTQVQVPTADLLLACRRVSALSTEFKEGAHVRLQVQNGKLLVTGRNDADDVDTELEVKAADTERVTLNSAFMEQVLEVDRKAMCKLNIAQSTQPMMFRLGDRLWQHVLMPVFDKGD